MEQEIYRKGNLNELKTFIRRFSPNEILLVCGEGSYAASGAQHFIEKELELKGVESFHGFSVNPKTEDLRKGISHFKSGKYKLIVAIGGGSVLDMGKLISVLSHQTAPLEEFITGDAPLEPHKTPLLAIPTTAGTGSEATMFAVIYLNNQKYSVSHPIVLPDAAYLSADFLATATPYLTACTGLDAFAQAVESVWSVGATPQSEAYALKAIELIWNNLYQAVNHANPIAKAQMLEASYLSGKAINVSKTTAPHAISYAFTTHYHIPHGHAVALSLPFFVQFNYALTEDNCIDPRGVSSVKSRIEKVFKLIGTNESNAYNVLKEFFSAVGISINLKELIGHFDYNLIANNINTERLDNNPRKVTKKDVLALLEHP